MTNEVVQTSTFEPSPGLAEQIADHVQKQIVSGELAPGERIAEAHITRELGVSRGPVRESMRLLSRRHLVDLLPRKGARVSDFGVSDVNSLYDLQIALLILLVRRVSECWKPYDLERFANLQKELSIAADEGDALGLISGSFEFQIAASHIVNNAYLTAALRDLQPSFSRAYYRALAIGQQEMKGLAEFIDLIITHLVEDNLEACEHLIDQFSNRQRQLVLDTFAIP
ncbi:MAG: GntR family transcriptional regulator [Gammaproteobacteria bacterium]